MAPRFQSRWEDLRAPARLCEGSDRARPRREGALRGAAPRARDRQSYWYLKIYGHKDVRILDGGRQKWIDEGRDLATDVAKPSPQQYTAEERNESIRARRDQVLEWIGAGDRALVDVRSPQEYSGELMAPPGYEQEGASRTGHIPTAQSIPWAQAVSDDGTFKPANELRELYGARASPATRR